MVELIVGKKGKGKIKSTVRQSKRSCKGCKR